MVSCVDTVVFAISVVCKIFMEGMNLYRITWSDTVAWEEIPTTPVSTCGIESQQIQSSGSGSISTLLAQAPKKSRQVLLEMCKTGSNYVYYFWFYRPFIYS